MDTSTVQKNFLGSSDKDECITIPNRVVVDDDESSSFNKSCSTTAGSINPPQCNDLSGSCLHADLNRLDNAPFETEGFAFPGPDSNPMLQKIFLRPLNEYDVLGEVEWTAVCHTDFLYEKWGTNPDWPMCAGHEAVFKIIKVGSKVTQLQVGDYAGLGYICNSCQNCEICDENKEPLCAHAVCSFDGLVDGHKVYGGFAKHVVVREKFAIKIPSGLNIKTVAPALCAGITCFAPMYRAFKKIKFESRRTTPSVLVCGIGGLGHLACKIAIAAGFETYGMGRSAAKKQEALALGIHEYVLTSDEERLRQLSNKFDIIVDTTTAMKNLSPELSLLRPTGTLILLGLPPVTSTKKDHWFPPLSLICKEANIVGSLVGGPKDYEEMMQFFEKHQIEAICEFTTFDKWVDAIEKIHNSQVRYRFVFDMKKSLEIAHKRDD